VSLSPSPAAELASNVARLFFDRQLSKVEIANRLGISRFRVARLIGQALDDGLVRIEFRDRPAEDRAAARGLEDRFGLDLAAIAADGETGSVDRVAALAALVLDGLIGTGETIGIAWGSTLARVARRLPGRTDSDLEVVQLAGSSLGLDRGLDPAEVSRVAAERLGARHLGLFAPAFVDSTELRDAMLREPDIAAATGAFDRLSLAIVGIGSIGVAVDGPDSSLLRSGAIRDEDMARLRAAGAVGDLIVHAFDRDGRFVAADLSARAMAIDVQRLQRARRVVAVAAGAGKAEAIRGALRTGVIRILVTDTAAARAVVAMDEAFAGEPAPRRTRNGARRAGGRNEPP
jgi:DNA-binding transcriptional regulator LsrR (DeoR family)